MIGATLSINGTGKFTYKASPVHCRNQYRIEHMLSQIISNCEILLLFLSHPPPPPTQTSSSWENHLELLLKTLPAKPRESQCDFHVVDGIHSISGYCQTNPARDDSSAGFHKVLLKGVCLAFGMLWIAPIVCDAPARGKRTSLTFPSKDIPSLHSAVLTACSTYFSLPKEIIEHSFLWQMISPSHSSFASETIFACVGKQMNKLPNPSFFPVFLFLTMW